MGIPKIILDLSYARLHKISRCNEKSAAAPKILLYKNKNSYEITFHDQNDYDDWMLKLKKICILTDFEEQYQLAEVTEISRGRCECLVEAKMGGNHYSARKFGKKHITGPENSFEMVRLMNKIEILRALRKKRVLKLHEVYETDDSIYLVTDFAKNTTLKKVLKMTSSPFDMSKTQTIMYQLLKTLAHMASKNVAHRNLKPSSIMMENKQNIRIINFGLATFINSPKANVGICGTPGYIAPEILDSHHDKRVYDDKVDVFSVGCIFFEMLFGYPLFKGSKTSEISMLNKSFKYSDLVQLVMKEQNHNNKCLLTRLSLDLLLKMLQTDPKQRISAKEALRHGFLESQRSTHSGNSSEDENEALRKTSQMSSPRGVPRRISFDLSSSFSEDTSSLENSTLSPSRDPFRELSVDKSRRCPLPSIFKLKSAEETKVIIPPKESNENLILLHIKESQGEEDSDNISDELSSSYLLKNCPIVSPRIKKHPNQRV